MKSLISPRCRGVLSGTTMAVCLVASFILLVVSVAQAVSPVPFVNQPLVPDAAAPGGPSFTLTVNGTGFVAGSAVHWNGSPRTTYFVSQGQLTATILATDIAEAGTVSVTVVSPGPGGVKSDPVFFPVAAPTSTVSLMRTDISSPGGNIQVVTADFNRDGNLDLATAGYYDSSVLIFLGNGDGTFTAGASYSACGAHALALGDFNGDGIVDLAVGSDSCGEVTILLGKGNGTFTESGELAIGPGLPYRLAAGDFNGDGNLDLVTANGDAGVISMLLGKGDGTFQGHVDYNIGQPSDGVTTADFDGDGHLDLAVTGNESVFILLGNGDGIFRSPSIYKLKAGTGGQCDGFFYGSHTPNVLAVDLNRNGKVDLVVPNTTGFVSLLLGSGDGTFHDGGSYHTGGCPTDVVAADLNGDGTVDLGLTNFYYFQNISVLLGNGDATFLASVNYPAGNYARGIAAGDFNGDGRLDLAVGNQYEDSISILLNTSSAAGVALTPASLTFAAQAIGSFSAAQSVTLKNTGGAALKIANISRASNDFYQSNNCPATLQPDASCTLNVIFTPTSGGTRLGFVTISDDGAGSPQKLPLKGTASGSGGVKLTLSPPALNFGSVAVGATSQPYTVTVSNVGSVAASFLPPFGFVKETPGCIFHHSPQCGTSLAPNASCEVTVTFTPRALGARTGQFVVLQGAHTVSMPLSGTGTP